MIELMRNTIKNHADFKTPRDFPYAVTDFFSIRTKMAKYPDDPRYGLMVTKRNFNRAKRLLRDWIAFADKYMCPELDYVFFARPEILGADVTREIGRDAMVHALKNIKHKYEKFQK